MINAGKTIFVNDRNFDAKENKSVIKLKTEKPKEEKGNIRVAHIFPVGETWYLNKNLHPPSIKAG